MKLTYWHVSELILIILNYLISYHFINTLNSFLFFFMIIPITGQCNISQLPAILRIFSHYISFPTFPMHTATVTSSLDCPLRFIGTSLVCSYGTVAYKSHYLVNLGGNLAKTPTPQSTTDPNRYLRSSRH